MLVVLVPEPLSPDAEVVVDGAEDADEDKCVEGAHDLPRLLHRLSLRFPRFSLFLCERVLGFFATMIPFVALFFLQAANVPVHIVRVPSVFRPVLQLLFSIFLVVCEILQVLELVFCHVVNLSFNLLHKLVIVRLHVFLLDISHLLHILRDGTLN